MSDEKYIPRWISITAAVSTLSVPFFYIFGYAYDQGYLHVFGVANDFFVRSPQEYLVLAFYSCLGIATSALDFILKKQALFFVFAMVFAVTTWCIVFAEKHRFDDFIRTKARPLKDHRLFDYFFYPLISASLTFILPTAFVTIIFLVVVVPAVSYFKGESVAKEKIEKTKPCHYSTAPSEGCVALIKNGKPIALGIFVARSESHLALYADGKTSIIPVKDQRVEVTPILRSPNLTAQETLHDKTKQRP